MSCDRAPFRSGALGKECLGGGDEIPSLRRLVAAAGKALEGGAASFAPTVRGAPRLAAPDTVPALSEVRDPGKPWELGLAPPTVSRGLESGSWMDHSRDWDIGLSPGELGG